MPSNKRLTIQSYPNEAVWFDGASVLQGWRQAGSTWYVDGWAHDFDSSPTFTRGAADSTQASWGFVDPAHPLAAHPEQVWVDGVPLTEVSSPAALTKGTFFADIARDRLYIGSDPRGSLVRASTLADGINVNSSGSVLRGVGVRGFATSVWMMGTVTMNAANSTIENVIIHDNATVGLYAIGSGVRVNSVTTARNGLLGVGANYADRLVVSDLLTLENNREQFNQSPVSGGIKVTRSRGVQILNSASLRNDGPGMWLDESVYDADLVGNDIIRNSGHGISLEISHRVDVADNVLLSNAGNGMKINGTGSVEVWNNTVVGGSRTINIVQDTRDPRNLSTPGHDPRQSLPDPTMPWLIQNVRVSNNVIAASSGNCTLCVEDYSKRFSAAALNVTSNGNVLQRASTSQPSWLVVWSRGAGNPATYTSLSAFASATGQASRSFGVDGRAVTANDGRVTPEIASRVPSIAIAPPATIGAALSLSDTSWRAGVAR